MSPLDHLDSFDSFSEYERNVLDRLLTERDEEDGYEFLTEGDEAGGLGASMFIVLQGEVQVTSGGDVELGTFGSGDVFGIMALLARSPYRSATCRARGDVRVAELSRVAYDQLVRSQAGVAVKFKLLVARQLARDLRRLTDLIREAHDGDDGPPRRAGGA